MTSNRLHRARLVTDAGGIPAHDHQRSEGDAGGRLDVANPDSR